LDNLRYRTSQDVVSLWNGTYPGTGWNVMRTLTPGSVRLTVATTGTLVLQGVSPVFSRFFRPAKGLLQGTLRLRVPQGAPCLCLWQTGAADRLLRRKTLRRLEIFTSPTLLRCTDQSWLNVDTNSTLVVDHGSTLRVEAGARLDVAHGAVLRVKRGGTLEIMDGAVLNVADSGRVVIEEGDLETFGDGLLVFRQGARINLEGTTGELEIAGQLLIDAGAVFLPAQAADATMTTGRLRFSSTRTPSTNIVAGTASAFVVRADHKHRRVLYVDQESLYGPPELTEFSLLTATAELADGARIVPPVTGTCAINFIDARVTSPPSGGPNTHRGLRLNGQPFVTLRNSTFQRGTYGLFSNSALLGAAPYLNNCLFEECGTGLYTFGLGVEADSCNFTQCGTGLLGEQLSQTSFLNHCAATYNQKGVSLQGSTTVRVTDPFFNQNQFGLVVEGIDARVACGSVSHNAVAGFLLRNGALLRMDSTTAEPHDPVWAVENGVTILCDLAENSYLNLGHNNLRPQSPGTQMALLGTFICQPYAHEQPAYRNNWDGTVGTALTSAEYDITSCGGNLVFEDPHSSDTTACGQAVPPCPVPPCWEEDAPDGFSEPPTWDAFMDCPGCRDVTTTELGTVPLNQAALDAKLMGDDDGETDNEKEAITRWAEILMHPLDSLKAEEFYLAEYGLALMLESYGDAFAKGQLLRDATNSETGDYLALVDSVLSKRIAESSADSLYHRRLFASVDKAQAYRMAGRFETAVTLMNGILGWVESEEEELMARIACLTALERDLADSTLHWDEVEDALALCSTSLAIANKPEKGRTLSHPPAPAPAQRISTCEPGIHPNPMLDGALIEGFPEEPTVVRITDLGGQEVWLASVNGKTVLPAGLLRPGLYLYSMTTASGTFCTGKLVVAK